MADLNRPLTDKVALVTGGSRGIGGSICKRLAEGGANVIFTYANSTDQAQKVEEACKSHRVKAEALQVDSADIEAGKQLAESVVEHHGPIDILVNNAGVGAVAPLMDTDEAMWDTMMDINAKGVLLCSQAAARQMIKTGSGGRIINNASGAGKIAPGKDVPLGAYAASKHAVVALTKQMGLELAQHRILVNCVCAGIVDTPMWDLIDREIAKREGAPIGSVKASAVDSIPLGRIQEPEDVANVVVFLASSDASYMTGQTYNVCGGILPY